MTKPHTVTPSDFEISTDMARIDVGRVEALLRGSYWAAERPRHLIEKSIQHSRCLGAYRKSDGLQVGFCRVVTDYVSFAWIADVIVDEAWRGAGIGKALMQAVCSLPDLQGVRLVLSTRDAHGLYEQFGFEPLPHPQQWMIRAGADGAL